MKSISVKCNAKINLSLDAIGKRADGYHLLELIFLEIPIFDIVTVTLREDNKIILNCDDKTLPTDSKNIAYRAAEEYIKATGSIFGADISLKKKIPHGAGLGGGSSDAAGVLKALNKLNNKLITDEEMSKIAAKLGADVPFFLRGGCALGEGIGEILTPLPKPQNLYFVIAKPEQSISTAYVFKNLDMNKKPDNLSVKKVVDGLLNNCMEVVYKNAGNILEGVTLLECPVINDIKKCMTENGAKLALMSGSGTAVFGIFEEKISAEKCGKELNAYAKDIYVV